LGLGIEKIDFHEGLPFIIKIRAYSEKFDKKEKQFPSIDLKNSSKEK
jgi:hypothetical protein